MSAPGRLARLVLALARRRGADQPAHADHCAVFAAFAAGLSRLAGGGGAPAIRQPALRQGGAIRPKIRRNQ